MRREITLNAKGLSGAGILGDVALLIRLDSASFNFSKLKEDGADIRFLDEDDKTVLKHHIEKFDYDKALIWVRLHDVKAGDSKKIYMYFANPGPKGVKEENPAGTYDENTKLVYHFTAEEIPVDSTSGGSNSMSPATVVDDTMIGSGISLPGAGPVQLPDSEALAWAGSMTWSVWFKANALKPNDVIFTRTDGANTMTIGLDNGSPYLSLGTSRSTPGAAVTENTWHHLAVTGDPSKMEIYLDGEPYSTLASPLPAMRGTSFLGSTAEKSFYGELDELQFSNTARSAAWINLMATSQSGEKAAALVVMGKDEETSTWMNGTFGTLMKSLTVDGWIVIGILAVMLVLSWWVMAAKAVYLNGVASGNTIFMREWAKLSSDLTALDDPDGTSSKSRGISVTSAEQKALKNSTVFKLYHTGSEEIRHRFTSHAKGEEKSLSARSIQAIRAAMDAGFVRQGQKLNSLIVLLTICISGGPFLGLLGTVVGVMITFAEIAKAGDVNVNAIAPGIAAALVATVAGLAVAIPALFGYNYLLARIKNANADMQVFIDEFVAKMAEHYSGSEEAAAAAGSGH